MKTFLVFVLPFIVAMFPLMALIACSRKASLNQTPGQILLYTLACALSGFISSILALMISGYGLSQNMVGDGPKCLTGIVVFVPIGGFFVLLSVVVGVSLAVRQTLRSVG